MNTLAILKEIIINKFEEKKFKEKEITNEFNQTYKFLINDLEKEIYLIDFNEVNLEEKLNKVFSLLKEEGYNKNELYTLYYVCSNSKRLLKSCKTFELKYQFNENDDNAYYYFLSNILFLQ